ncbi:helix-turn-helix domain-containing protein [Shimazuella kribbensis]|uniref:helix-turn-helix domain-containing protein n=1 Tax=Shimazuella kribbensis TaxID=139808 RepID=UPI0004158B9B|nr:helix-turn-helix domain-containing protein [Shimazuella kribbensis]
MQNDSVVQFRGTVYENGSGMVAKKVMRDITISRDAKALYAYLCSFAWGGTDTERSAFPKVETQCHELQIKTEKSYYRYRKELLMSGYITIEKKRNTEGKFKSNIYYIEAVPVPKTEEEVKKMLRELNDKAKKDPQGKKESVDQKSHTVKKRRLVKTTLGLNHTRSKEGSNNKQSLRKTNSSKQDQVLNNNIEEVVGVKYIIKNSFKVDKEIDNKDIDNLIDIAKQANKDLTEVIANTKTYFETSKEPIKNLVGSLIYEIETGWSVPSKATSKAKTLHVQQISVQNQINEAQQETAAGAEGNMTAEELQGTYEDIQATMKFLRSTEKHVANNNGH